MYRYLTGFFSLLIVLVVTLDSCVSHDFPAYICDEEYTFSEDIKPIIETKCALSGCHNGDMGPDVNWTNFEEFHKRATRGEVKSRVINHIMPPSDSPGGPLSQEQIDAIACWSDQGAQKN